MARYAALSASERAARCLELSATYQGLYVEASSIQSRATALLREGKAPATIQSEVETMLTAWGARVAAAEVASALLDAHLDHKAVIQSDSPPLHISTIFVTANQDARAGYPLWETWIIIPSDMRATYGGVFEERDVVLIENASTESNDGPLLIEQYAYPPMTNHCGPEIDPNDEPNLIENGRFLEARLAAPLRHNFWTTSGVWAVDWTADVGGVTHVTGNAATLTQTAAGDYHHDPILNTKYLVKVTVKDVTVGGLYVRGTGNIGTLYLIASGTYYLVDEFDAATPLLFTPTNDFVGTITEVVMVAFPGIMVQRADAFVADGDDKTVTLTLAERLSP